MFVDKVLGSLKALCCCPVPVIHDSLPPPLTPPPDTMPSARVQALAQEINARRKTNIHGYEFVPFEWLVELLTLDAVEDVLSEGDIELFERRSIAEVVLQSGLKTFATLLLVGEPDRIYNLRRADPGVEKGGPDNKLPLTATDLNNIFDKQRTRDDFLESQFLFLIPTFPQGIPHRVIPGEIRLPFLKLDEDPNAKKTKPLEGHFGAVSKEKLPPKKYGLGDDEGMTLVRKMLKTKGGDAYVGELRCLRLLNTIRHPSILELCGSYTQHQTHNFLFTEATGGDLYSLLRKGERPPEFRKNEAVYLAICGLASALEQLHYYSNDDLKLELLGCHHDLKPRNVLVDKGRFILADFGLTKMSESIQDVKQLAEDRDLYFDAPERMDYTMLQPVKKEIGPPSDIWSLGGILAVIFAYLKGGPDEVENFKDKRTFIYMPEEGKPGMLLKSFHERGEPNGGVEEWFAEEGKPRNAAEEDLVSLIRAMLTIDSAKRPEIRTVLSRLRCIALKETAEPIIDHLSTSPKSGRLPEPLEYAVERQVFLEWLRLVSDTSRLGTLTFLRTDEMFAQVHGTVCAIRDEFRQLSEASRDDAPLFSRLRRLNSQLLACLDEASQDSARSIAELKVMPRAREIAREVGPLSTEGPPLTVARLDEDAKPYRLDENVKLLLSAENVMHLMARSESVVPKLDASSISRFKAPVEEKEDGEVGEVEDGDEEDDPGEIRTFWTGTLNEKGSSTAVIVEDLEIGPAFNDTVTSKELFEGLEQVLGLSPELATRFRALSCAGIYHDIKRRTIGLTYHYPNATTHSAETRPRVRHLAEILREHRDPIDIPRSIIVSLDDRLRLAHDLATAVFEFHKMDWWHKNISSHNVLFFGEKTISHSVSGDGGSDSASDGEESVFQKVNLDSPALIGFSHSRRGDADYSNKMHSDIAVFAYWHPDYAGADAADIETASGYLAEYDYYGLGLVLLEIGVWNPVWRMVRVRSMERDEMRAELRRRWVPLLASVAGEMYARAVDACLSGRLSEFGKVTDKEKVDLAFERLVLRSLRTLVRT